MGHLQSNDLDVACIPWGSVLATSLVTPPHSLMVSYYTLDYLPPPTLRTLILYLSQATAVKKPPPNPLQGDLGDWKPEAHLVLVWVAALPEPEPQELLINVLWLLLGCHACFIAVCQPVPAGVWCVDLPQQQTNIKGAATARELLGRTE